MSTQAETNRTRYESTIRLTAREKRVVYATIQLTARERGAVYRFLRNRDIAMGDYTLTFGVLRRVLDSAKKEAHGKGTNRGP